MTDQQGDGEKLHGWKEIANHFNRTPRTVQRWEREFGLPVHRLGLGRAEVVSALRSELDAWERQRAALPPADAGPGAAKDRAAEAGALPSPSPDEASPLVSEPARRRSWWGASLLLAGLAAIAIWSWLTLPDPPAAAVVPTKAVVEANTLRVFAADGRELWSYRFEHPVEEGYYRDPVWTMLKPLQFHDLDRDGTRELLAVAIYTDASHGSDLVCFEADGTVRFTWGPSRDVAYGDNTWGPPFRVYSALAADGDGPRALWVNAVHHLYFPSIIARLDRHGRVQSEFWADGHATVLALGRFRGRPVVFVGAANNEFKRAAVTVIDAETGSGSTPAIDPAYRCRNCPPGAPLASLVFPVPDLAGRLGEGGIPAAMSLLPNDAGGLAVGVGFPMRRYSDPRGTPLQGAFYEFDREMRPVRAEFTAQYIAAHGRAEEDGLIGHKYDPRVEERQLFPILSWNGRAYVPVSPERR